MDRSRTALTRGQLIAEGPPSEVAQNEKSYTGQYLKRYFKNGGRKKTKSSRREKAQVG